jgi:selenide, water dikinase
MADQTKAPRLTSLSPGAGCACKLPLAKLEALFATMGDGVPAMGPAAGDLLVGALEGDDAAVLRLDDERALVLTTDFFTPIVDDPGDWGRIAAANALSDVYAMGGRPLFAVNLAAWPGDGLDLALLGQVLRGGAQVAAEAGCFVAGGHTIDDPVPKYGLAVVGLADPAALLTIDRAAPGDQLILTKAIGTGVVATALKHGAAPAGVIEAAVASMTLLNASASQAALAAGVRAATDVTGFGLMGHLHRMLAASGVAARLGAASVPLLPGAAELAAAGFVSGGTRANTERMRGFAVLDAAIPAELSVLLHDAQTSGGLLLAAPRPAAAALASELRAQGLPAAVIGEVIAGESGRVDVQPGPFGITVLPRIPWVGENEAGCGAGGAARLPARGAGRGLGRRFPPGERRRARPGAARGRRRPVRPAVERRVAVRHAHPVAAGRPGLGGVAGGLRRAAADLPGRRLAHAERGRPGEDRPHQRRLRGVPRGGRGRVRR